jgi:hypothetical protein
VQVYKSKWFSKWALKERLTDNILKKTVTEMQKGLIDADLGSYVYKKRLKRAVW